MSNSVLLQIPCLETQEYSSDYIYKKFFNKKGNKNNLEQDIQHFIFLNQRLFSFLGINTYLSGSKQDLSLSIQCSNYMGAIPIRLPDTGLPLKDLYVIPRFSNSKDNSLEEIVKLINILSYSIEPEYINDLPLNNSFNLRPPNYHEAAKYINLFEVAYRHAWSKFNTACRIHPYPKNTIWEKHIQYAFDPKRTLNYPSHDNILSINHDEFQQLKYAFEIAKSILNNNSTPLSIRLKHQDMLLSLSKRLETIPAKHTKGIPIHAIDPSYIKEAKRQANIVIQNDYTSCLPWRIDIAQLFERYVQYIINKCIIKLGGKSLANPKFMGHGRIPHWGINYLEPDIMIEINNCVIIADAKYKSHLLNAQSNTDFLKDTHRSDIHQLLAYCSFTPQQNKAGLLFYPANQNKTLELAYTNSLNGIKNHVALVGICFNYDSIQEVTEFVESLLIEYSNICNSETPDCN